MREPIRWRLQFGESTCASHLEEALRCAAVGPCDIGWRPPGWLLPHQVHAAKRIKAIIEVFRGALLADALGLGKTYVALALATRYERTTVVVPATLLSQWNRVSERLGIAVSMVTHEALSRMAVVPASDLVVVDEAHRFRNPNTRRYRQLAAGVRDSRMLLLTATPVVNRPSDLGHLLRLFCSDGAFALFGLASVEDSIANHDHALLTQAVAQAVVARSPESIDELRSDLPTVTDETVSRTSCVEPIVLPKLLELIDKLQFPSHSDSNECELLRLHLFFRLASSVPAFRGTLRRHLAYTERALDAVGRGAALSRSYARQVFSHEAELQLALGDIPLKRGEFGANAAALEQDRRHLTELMALLARTNGTCPKSLLLEQILRERSGRKTIVFTAAVKTALELARFLQWKEIAVVGGGHGWIASGKIPADEALALFAPLARGKAEPCRSMRVSTLIATDMASEGLDLQDADSVVHYDLPWTPLALEQRVGRIARLGSSFRTTRVFWFAPPVELDRKLQIEARIARKVGDQIGLHVTTTSQLGRARIVNHELQCRERLGRRSGSEPVPKGRHSVVAGPRRAVVAVEWRIGEAVLPELITLSGSPPRQLTSFAETEIAVNELLTSPPSSLPPPKELVDTLLRVIRRRLAAADRGPVSQLNRRLRWSVLRRASDAGRRREQRLLSTLDDILERLRQGLSVGSERRLARLLSSRACTALLTDWLNEQPAVHGSHPTFEIVAALFGDGSEINP